jgi:prevent-host-death family protein
MVMSKVRIADLKAHLSAHLKKVRAGHSLVILDRDVPIARIIPYDDTAPLEIRRATRKPSELRLPPPLRPPVDAVALLLEDRASR